MDAKGKTGHFIFVCGNCWEMKFVFYARPHLFPLPQERTCLRTIRYYLSTGRANTAGSELKAGRRTIHLLPGEKVGMRADVSPLISNVERRKRS
jgi:hypothetical protein